MLKLPMTAAIAEKLIPAIVFDPLVAVENACLLLGGKRMAAFSVTICVQ
jgi:hypothetical protein